MPALTRVGALFLGVLVFAVTAGAQELTESQLVELIVRDGAQARAIRMGVEVTRQEQSARAVFPNPGVAYTREGAGVTEFLLFEQPLPIFGSRAAVDRAGAAATAAAEAERDAALAQLRADAQALVARLMAEQETRQATITTVTDVARIVEILRIREQEGEGSRFDRLRAGQELAEAQLTALDAAAAAAESRASIVATLAAGTRLTRVTGTLYTPRVLPATETLEARAVSTHGQIRALQLASDRFLLEADAARQARQAVPVAVAGVKRVETVQGKESGGVFGVSVNIPLFDTGGREAARWLAERDRADAERTFAAQSIRAKVAAASEVLALRQDAVRTADAAPPAEELLRIAEVAYAEGDVGIIELLDAHRTAARARIRAIEMRLAARLAQIALERAVGDTIWP